MTSTVIVGMQWGDEGKGKITDFLSQEANVIARYQGGNNAGHTIVFNGETYKLHLIPSGIFDDSKISVIGNGVVVDPKALVEELEYLHNRGISTDNLRISNRCHIILPYHLRLDRLQEEAKGDQKIGTTIKGIGPCYVDKYARIGIRMADLLDRDTFAQKLKQNLSLKNREIAMLYGGDEFTFDEIFEEYYNYGQELQKYVTDTSVIVNEAMSKNQKVLFEGAQGVMLDIDHGTYPYVTSSNPIAGGSTVGTGIGPMVDNVLGVAKAYTSRVGDGPFPTELFDEVGETIREVGHEYGTTTGRPRRVGWFDAVVMRHAMRVSGINKLSVNCLDVLSGLKELKIAISYDLDGEQIDYYPASLAELQRCKPNYLTLPGWSEDITGCQSFDELPQNAQKYLQTIEELVGVKLVTFAVGPDRKQTIILDDIWGN